MTLKELYEELEGDFCTISSCLVEEKRIEKYVLMFLRDDSYEQFMSAMKNRDASVAFRAVHTLKGVCLNLGFTKLFKISDVITELLRDNDSVWDCEQYVPELCRAYEQHIHAIEKYKRLNNV